MDFARCSNYHRTTIAHFLNKRKWDSGKLEEVIQAAVIWIIYDKTAVSGKSILCMADDTIASKTRPSSRALHPIKGAYFHYSHSKKQMDYGHQAIAAMQSCNGITLHYAVAPYDKSKSNIQLVREIAEKLPISPVIFYLLCDCWYLCQKVMDAFIQKGFYTAFDQYQVRSAQGVFVDSGSYCLLPILFVAWGEIPMSPSARDLMRSRSISKMNRLFFLSL